MNELHPIFADCCHEPYNGRFDIGKPFVVDGMIYATDGRIAVRGPIPTTLPPLSIAHPNPRNLPWDVAVIPEPINLPDIPVQMVTCGDCEGTGRPSDYELDSGVCEWCDGMKVVEKAQVLHVRGKPGIAGRYVRLLRKHGAQVLVPVKKKKGRDVPNPFKFAIPDTGIEGLLMPMHIEDWMVGTIEIVELPK